MQISLHGDVRNRYAEVVDSLYRYTKISAECIFLDRGNMGRYTSVCSLDKYEWQQITKTFRHRYRALFYMNQQWYLHIGRVLRAKSLPIDIV